jgi:hypothetical protein
VPVSFSHYDPDHYSVVYNGVPIEGFSDEDFIQIEMATDGFTDEVGADGHVTRLRTRDQRATITFKLRSHSPTNKVLSAFYLADLNAPNGTGAGAILIRDTQGATIFAGAQAWITGWPKTAVGKKAADREWKIRVASLEAFHG